MLQDSKKLVQGVYRIRLAADSDPVYMQSNVDDPKKPFIELGRFDKGSERQKVRPYLCQIRHGLDHDTPCVVGRHAAGRRHVPHRQRVPKLGAKVR